MTTFQTPLKTQGASGDTGSPLTETSGYVKTTKVRSLGVGSSRTIVTLPDKSTLVGLGAVPTSAFAADVSAMVVSFGNSADTTRYGAIAVSALGQCRAVAIVSGATDFDVNATATPNTIVITASAVSTTTFTAGGVRAFIEYVTAE